MQINNPSSRNNLTDSFLALSLRKLRSRASDFESPSGFGTSEEVGSSVRRAVRLAKERLFFPYHSTDASYSAAKNEPTSQLVSPLECGSSFMPHEPPLPLLPPPGAALPLSLSFVTFFYELITHRCFPHRIPAFSSSSISMNSASASAGPCFPIWRRRARITAELLIVRPRKSEASWLSRPNTFTSPSVREIV